MKTRIHDNGTKEYFNDKDQLHRENGPAIEYADGSKSHYINGELHRENGPACEYANGDKSYWINGKRHREDGPALEFVGGDKYYYINGQLIQSEEEYWRLIKLRAFT